MQDTQNIQKDTQSTPIRPLISFIITAYNIPPKMLRQCISSIMVLSLSREQREIIVVDDGSSTPMINALKDFQDDILYIYQRNQGVSVARNTGMNFAVGEYIQFVDGDDFLLQTPYEHCLDIIRYSQQVDLVSFNATSSSETSMTLEYKGPFSGTAFMTDNNLHGAVWGYIIKNELLKGLEFEPGIAYSEDELLTPQFILRAKNMYATEAKAYYYRHRRGAATHLNGKANKEKRLSDNLYVLLKLKDMMLHIEEEGKRKALERRVSQMTMDYLYNVIRLTKSRSRLKNAEDALKEHGLYPLPANNYTLKYTLFRKLI